MFKFQLILVVKHKSLLECSVTSTFGPSAKTFNFNFIYILKTNKIELINKKFTFAH